MHACGTAPYTPPVNIRWLQAKARKFFGTSEKEAPAAAPNPEPPPLQGVSMPPLQGAAKLLADARRECDAGRGANGLKLTREAAAINPDAPELHYIRGICLSLTGRHDEALESFRRELARNPEHADARNHHDNLVKALARPAARHIPTHERDWHSSIPLGTLIPIQQALHNYHYRGVPLLKNPFDMALYPMLLWQVKPRTIIEIGSKSGGSAFWFGDLLDNFGVDGHVYSIDIVQVTDVKHPRVTYMEGSGRELADCLSDAFLATLPRPWLIIEDADHAYETSIATLRFFHPRLEAGEYIVVEDGIISDLSQVPDCNSGPHLALKEFLKAHPDEYEIDGNYCDFFGYNATWCTNGFLRKLGLEAEGLKAKDDLAKARALAGRGEHDAAAPLLSALKARRARLQGIDYLRALFFQARHENPAAIEALKEELRYFPDNREAAELLGKLLGDAGEQFHVHDQEFSEIFSKIRPYTMLGEARLFSLFKLAKLVCESDLPGNFVECGVAAGGSSALLATVIARHSKRPRILFSFDTFEGLPTPTALDTHQERTAETLGWGTGTCAAPEASLREICEKLGVGAFVEPVKGLFSDSLPATRERVGPVALLHMDGDWYASTTDILENLFDQVVPGGRIQIDDYGYWDGCRRAVADFEQKRGLKFQLHTIDETGVWLSR